MKISILRHTFDYRGDHSADVAIAYDSVDGETVTELCERVFGRNSRQYMDRIEIRLVLEGERGEK